MRITPHGAVSERFMRHHYGPSGYVKKENTVEITIGRIVLYTLTEQDAAEINRRRTNGSAIAERIKRNTPDTSAWPIGAQAHIGNEVKEGDLYPMIVTKVWSPGTVNGQVLLDGKVWSPGTVNGQVLLDGNDCLWATSAHEGTGGHSWAWPPRV